jgi:Zn-dependent protease with chaperone function
MLYRTMAIVLADILAAAAAGLTIPGALLSTGLVYAFFYWFRKSELTADRAGLLTVQDPEVAISSLLKLSGGSRKLVDDLSVDEFTKQADLNEDMDDSMLSLVYKLMIIKQQTHPFPALRARELREWSQSEQYKRLLRGDYPRSNTDVGIRTCAECAAIVTNVTFRYCPDCGASLTPAI